MPTQDVTVLARDWQSSKRGALWRSPTSKRARRWHGVTALVLAAWRAALLQCHSMNEGLVSSPSVLVWDGACLREGVARRQDAGGTTVRRVRLGSACGLVVWGGAHLSIASSHVEDLV